MNATIWTLSLLSAGYGLRYLQDARFWRRHRRQRRCLSETAVDTARILNGITDKVPAVSLSPLIRQYLVEKKMVREYVLSFFTRRPTYIARHSANGYSSSEIIQINTTTAPLDWGSA